MSYTVDELQALMLGFQKSGLSRFRYTTQGETLELRNEAAGRKIALHAERIQDAAISAGPDTAMEKKAVPDKEETSTVESGAAEENLVQIRTPLAGIFYRAAKPGEKPYVEEGQSVKKGDVVGLVEAMKIMNEIAAPCDGVIHEILLGDACFAAYDAVLMTMEES